jgi:hypothetical protein
MRRTRAVLAGIADLAWGVLMAWISVHPAELRAWMVALAFALAVGGASLTPPVPRRPSQRQKERC